MSNKFQNEDFKSELELTTAGGTKAQLLNTTKIYSPKSADVLETLLRKNNYAASTEPAVTNDSSQGYQVGSVWIDTVNGKAYNCISAAVGAAFWKEGGGGVATANGLTAIITILNNQTTFVNSGIVFTYPTIKSFEIFGQIIRTTTTGSASEVTKLLGVYDIALSKWTMTDTAAGLSGVEFQITAIGELQYKSSNLAGASYVGELSYSYQANGGAISGTNPSDLSSDGLNFIKGNAESGTTGWTTYADAAARLPVDGVGGTANVTFTTTTTTPLRGLKSYLLTKDAVNRQGQGVDYDFTIDDASKAKVLTIDFDYLVASGTFVAGSPTTDSDVIVYIYDVTNARLIEPSSIKLLGNSTTVANKFSATFQTSHNSNSYRLIFHVASTSALAYSLKIDNISVSPSKYVYGTPITDWQSYTPILQEFSQGNGSLIGFWRRVGDSIEVSVGISAGSSGATGTTNPWNIRIPNGLLFDLSKNNNASFPAIGVASIHNGGAYVNEGIVAIYANNSVGIITSSYNTSTGGLNAGNWLNINLPQPTWWNNSTGDSVSVRFSFPIVGWSSSTQMSDSADTRIVACKLRTTAANTTVSAGNTIINWNAVEFDTHGAFQGGSSGYKVPVSGIYKITSHILHATKAWNAPTYLSIGVGVNGSVLSFSEDWIPAAYTGYYTSKISESFSLKAGDIIDIRLVNGSNTSTSLYTPNSLYNFCNIERITGPSAIAASESVVEIRENTAGTVIPTNTLTTIPYNTVIKSSHGSWSSNRFYAPIAGTYNISLAYQHVSAAIARPFEIVVLKNNLTTELQTAYRASSTATTDGSYGDRHSTSFSTLVDMKSGDFIELKVIIPSGSAPLAVGISSNRIAIHRVGN